MMNWSSANDWGWGAWVVMCTMMVVFWAVVIWVVLAVGRQGTDGSSRRSDRSATEPQRVLADRFARGEIDAEEYERRRSVLDDAPIGRSDP